MNRNKLEEIEALVSESIRFVNHNGEYAARYGVDESERWDLTKDDKEIVFTFKDGTKKAFPCVLIGSWSQGPETPSWLWSWDFSAAGHANQPEVLLLKEFGIQNDSFKNLLSQPIQAPANETLAVTFAAIACHLLEGKFVWKVASQETPDFAEARQIYYVVVM